MGAIVLFGGAGFVGTHLVPHLRTAFGDAEIIVVDKDISSVDSRTRAILADVRRPIELDVSNVSIDAIVNLAAVHKSPGHPSQEYFEANILGARNICAFAEKHNVPQIIFTSSIAVYGPGEDEKTEESLTMPNIPYGISKIIAEYVHREWHMRASGRKLSIIRPGVIFGKGEKGNVTRMASAMRRGIFVYPGRKDTIKACTYVKDLCRFIVELLEKKPDHTLHNFCFPQKLTTEDFCRAFNAVLGYSLPKGVVPLRLVNGAAGVLRVVDTPFIRSLGLDPQRIAKLVHSTNISSKELGRYGFTFKYDLVSAIRDWADDCGGKTLN